jgi:RNA polymerase sigma factor (sigma-70 family)
LKRGGVAVSLEESVLVAPDREAELLAIDEALTRLAGNDERAARVVELHYFGGLTYDEIAEALGISAATVDRDLRFAKAWLYRELKGGG